MALPGVAARLRGDFGLRFHGEAGTADITVRPFAPPATGELFPLATDPPPAALTLDPPEVTLPVPGLTLTASGVNLGGAGLPGPLLGVLTSLRDVQISLPRLPMFGELDIDLTELAIGPPLGLTTQTTVTIPHEKLGPLTVDLEWASPGARTIADAVPNSVRVAAAVPIDLTVALPSDGGTAGDVSAAPPAGNEPVRVIASLAKLPAGGMRMSLELDAPGGSDGLVVVDDQPAATALAAALMLAAGLAGDEAPAHPGSDDVALAAIIGGAAAAASAELPGSGKILRDGKVALQAVRLEATTDPGGRVTMKTDVTASLGVKVGLGPVGIRTDPDGPMRVRFDDLAVSLDPGAPGLTAVSASLSGAKRTLEHPGDWIVDGLGDLLRVKDVRSGEGSTWFEITLALGVDLGLVRVDDAVIRVTLDGGPPTPELRGLGATVRIPGILEGSGSGRIADGAIEAALAAELPALGIAADGSFVYRESESPGGSPMLQIRIGVLFPGPIPLANTGFGLFGVGGLVVINGTRDFEGIATTDPVQREFDWRLHPQYPKFAPEPGSMALGVKAVVGTLPDLGYALSAVGSLIVEAPDPAVVCAIDVHLLGGRPSLETEPRPVGIGISGLFAINGTGLTLGARGRVTIDKLVEAQIPIGAFFPFASGPAWYVRIGADSHGTPRREGGPISIAVLPDLIDLSATAFLMLEGGGLMALGGKFDVAPSGFAIGFGVAWDISWVAFPLRFGASGEILVGLGTDPWGLVGHARVGGVLALGPVSLSLSAELDVQVMEQQPLYAHGAICGYVDCFFFEIGGCIDIELGTKPAAPIEEPPSPLKGMSLVDRMGRVLQAESGAPAATVWPDAIPVLSFSNWVTTDLTPGPFQKHLVGQPPPPVDGWMGNADLAYRFALTAVELFTFEGGQEIPVSGDLWSAWSLPSHGVPYGHDSVPPVGGSRQLNLLTWERALWARSLIDGGEGAPGDPATSVGIICLPPPPISCTILFGRDVFAVSDGWAMPPPGGSELSLPGHGGFTAVAHWNLQDTPEITIATAGVWAAEMGLRFDPGGVQRFGQPLGTSLGEFDSTWVLPRMRRDLESDQQSVIRIVPSEPLLSPELHLSIDPDPEDRAIAAEFGRVVVAGTRACDGSFKTWTTDEGGGGGVVAGTIRAIPPDESGACPDPSDAAAEAWSEIFVMYQPLSRPGVLGLSGCLVSSERQRRADEDARRRQREKDDEVAASPHPVGRSLLEPGTTYRIRVRMTWQGRTKDPSSVTAPVDLPARTFEFKTAPEAHYGADDLPGFMALLMTGHDGFDGRGLARYVRGFRPTDGARWHFTGDPLSVDLAVDYLDQLVGLYGRTLKVRARRVDRPPGSPPAIDPDHGGVGLELFAPLWPAVLDTFDRRVLSLATACTVPPSGGVTAIARVPLDPAASYEVRLVAATLPGEGKPTAVVTTALIETSAYEHPDALLAACGFTASPAEPGHVGDVEIDEPSSEWLQTLPAASIRSDQSLEDALRRLRLDPWPRATGPRVARLWARPASPGVGWRLCGIVLEANEPLEREDRLRIEGLDHPSGTFEHRISDSLGARNLFLSHQPAPVAAGGLTVRAVSIEPWNPARERPITMSMPIAESPAWATEVEP
jgi:hypothetical protein